jgi:hypothetical protein
MRDDPQEFTDCGSHKFVAEAKVIINAYGM